jgi:hypothetical protein
MDFCPSRTPRTIPDAFSCLQTRMSAAITAMSAELYTKLSEWGLIMTLTGIDTDLTAFSIRPWEGVSPPTYKAETSSIRVAPPFSMLMQSSTVEAMISIIGIPLYILKKQKNWLKN